MKTPVLILLSITLLGANGCKHMTPEQKAVWGAAAGAIVGGVIGSQSGSMGEGIALGAAIGGVGGYGVGVYQQEQAIKREQEALAREIEYEKAIQEQAITDAEAAAAEREALDRRLAEVTTMEDIERVNRELEIAEAKLARKQQERAEALARAKELREKQERLDKVLAELEAIKAEEKQNTLQ